MRGTCVVRAAPRFRACLVRSQAETKHCFSQHEHLYSHGGEHARKSRERTRGGSTTFRKRVVTKSRFCVGRRSKKATMSALVLGNTAASLRARKTTTTTTTTTTTRSSSRRGSLVCRAAKKDDDKKKGDGDDDDGKNHTILVCGAKTCRRQGSFNIISFFNQVARPSSVHANSNSSILVYNNVRST